MLQVYDPGGSRTRDLRIKRTVAPSVSLGTLAHVRNSAALHSEPFAPGSGIFGMLGSARAVTLPSPGVDPVAAVTRPTMDELRATMPTKGGKKRGLYAAPPGTGPLGRTCHHCAFLTYSGHNTQHPKCDKVKWTSGDATTILTRTPACRYFEQNEARP